LSHVTSPTLAKCCVCCVINQEYGWDCPAGQEAAYTAYVDAVLSDYRKRQANAPVSHEQAAEMRAAFGPGRTVVNVITGRKFRT